MAMRIGMVQSRSRRQCAIEGRSVGAMPVGPGAMWRTPGVALHRQAHFDPRAGALRCDDELTVQQCDTLLHARGADALRLKCGEIVAAVEGESPPIVLDSDDDVVTPD